MMFEIGRTAEIRRTYSDEDLSGFQTLAGDGGSRVSNVPGPLIGALFSYLLGVRLPGPGTNYLKQELNFEDEAGVGEELTARITLSRYRPEKHLVDFATECFGEDGRRICSGRALVYVEDVTG